MDVLTSGVALPALHRAFMDTARQEGSTAALHACACFTEQLLSDTAAAAEEAPDAERTGLPVSVAVLSATAVEVRELCTALAREMAADADAPAREADERIGVLEPALDRATATSDALWRSAAARTDPVTAALLRHAGDWKTPECYGYDLADPELSLAQATEWLGGRPADESVLVVAVRTGGSYLAPFWQAAVEDAGRATGTWRSVRPVRGADGITLPPGELAAFPRVLPSGTAIVMVDDQPDTGATARAVHTRLARRFPTAGDIVLAAPGRLYDLRGPAPRLVAGRSPVRTGADRLWQLAGSGDTDRLVSRVRAAGVPLPPGAHRVEPFRGRFLAAYGVEPGAVKSGGAHRIDARNQPFTLVAAGHTARTHHFRFIGTGPHGRHCFRALRAMAELLPPGAAFVDGYLVTPHESGLRPLREALPLLAEEQQGRVLDAVARSWHGMRRLGELSRVGSEAVYDPRERLAQGLRRLRDRLGRALPVDDAWLARHVPDRAPLGGVDGVLFRTPLPYGHGFWHWQLAGGEGAAAHGSTPALRRFGPDWIWGGGGCLESEIASFVVENRLDGRARELLRRSVARTTGDARAFDAGLRLAGEALYWNVKTWLRRCPEPAGATADRIEAELAASAGFVAALP
ncbi:Neamine phosphoribosyltransferase [Streptomyces alboniger]